MKRFIIPLLCCLLNASLAQKNYQGIVVDSVTMQGIPLVHVTNKRNQATATTNENGIFKIKAFAADTLVFSSVGYQTIVLP
ncbi:MAG: carboxypeptidase-like regulatory domain-containing protein, partial [Chryseotalea sp.]